MDQVKFSSIALSDELKRAVAEMGYDEATLIQSQSIPLILAGHDVIGRSQTGSGKTAAFGLPAIEMIDTQLSKKTVQVLILCPTRELAVQASDEMKKFAKFKSGITVVPIYGGEHIGLQLSSLRQGCQIVVGTPGRVMDHMRRKTLRLQDVKMVVLDEVDEMLNMGFVEDIETILSETPETRQTILFSATMPASVLAITKKFQKDPRMVEIKQAQKTVSTTEQFFFNTPKGQKTAALCRLLEYYKPSSSIIFCNTKLMVDELILELKKFGYHAQGLHGDMRQSARTQVMSQFKKGLFDILVATDVAARGIDIDNISLIINYDIPKDGESYVHRIGRTGRLSNAGRAVTFVTPEETAQLDAIEKYTGKKLDYKRRPEQETVNEQRPEFAEKISTAPEAKKEKGAALGKEILKLHINAGKKTKMRAVDIVGTLCNIPGMTAADIGIINIVDVSTFVEVLNNKGEMVFQALQTMPVKGRLRKVSKAE